MEVIGDWMLFAGPLLQAATELRQEADGWDDVHAHMKNATSSDDWPERVSFLWWLFPPVKIILEMRRNRHAHKIVSRELSEEELKTFRIFGLKARAWLMVAAGAWLMGAATTHKITEEFNLGFAGWLGIVTLITVFCICTITFIFGRKTKLHNTGSLRKHIAKSMQHFRHS